MPIGLEPFLIRPEVKRQRQLEEAVRAHLKAKRDQAIEQTVGAKIQEIRQSFQPDKPIEIPKPTGDVTPSPSGRDFIPDSGDLPPVSQESPRVLAAIGQGAADLIKGIGNWIQFAEAKQSPVRMTKGPGGLPVKVVAPQTMIDPLVLLTLPQAIINLTHKIFGDKETKPFHLGKAITGIGEKMLASETLRPPPSVAEGPALQFRNPNWWTQGVFRNLPLMAANIASALIFKGKGPRFQAIAFAAPTALQVGGSVYESTRQMLIEQGMSEEIAAKTAADAALLAASGSAYLDRFLGARILLGGTKDAAMVYSKSLIRRFASKVAATPGVRGITIEPVTEMLQGAWEDASQYIETHNPKAFEGFMERRAAEGLLSIPLGAGTDIAAGKQKTATAKLKQTLIDRLKQSQGVSPDAAQTPQVQVETPSRPTVVEEKPTVAPAEVEAEARVAQRPREGEEVAAKAPPTPEARVVGGKEITVTVTDKRINDGRPTNIPSIVQGAKGIEEILSSGKLKPGQFETAIKRAAERIAAGEVIPSYETVEEATAAAQGRPVAKVAAKPPPLPSKLILALDRIENTARNRLKKRKLPGKGRFKGGTTLGGDIVDAAIIAATRAAKLGIRGGRALGAQVQEIIDATPHLKAHFGKVLKRATTILDSSLDDKGQLDPKRMTAAIVRLKMETAGQPAEPAPAVKPTPAGQIAKQPTKKPKLPGRMTKGEVITALRAQGLSETITRLDKGEITVGEARAALVLAAKPPAVTKEPLEAIAKAEQDIEDKGPEADERLFEKANEANAEVDKQLDLKPEPKPVKPAKPVKKPKVTKKMAGPPPDARAIAEADGGTRKASEVAAEIDAHLAMAEKLQSLIKQKDISPQVISTQAKALRERLKNQAAGARKGFPAGKREGVAKTREDFLGRIDKLKQKKADIKALRQQFADLAQTLLAATKDGVTRSNTTRLIRKAARIESPSQFAKAADALIDVAKKAVFRNAVGDLEKVVGKLPALKPKETKPKLPSRELEEVIEGKERKPTEVRPPEARVQVKKLSERVKATVKPLVDQLKGLRIVGDTTALADLLTHPNQRIATEIELSETEQLIGLLSQMSEDELATLRNKDRLLGKTVDDVRPEDLAVLTKALAHVAALDKRINQASKEFGNKTLMEAAKASAENVKRESKGRKLDPQPGPLVEGVRWAGGYFTRIPMKMWNSVDRLFGPNDKVAQEVLVDAPREGTEIEQGIIRKAHEAKLKVFDQAGLPLGSKALFHASRAALGRKATVYAITAPDGSVHQLTIAEQASLIAHLTDSDTLSHLIRMGNLKKPVGMPPGYDLLGPQIIIKSAEDAQMLIAQFAEEAVILAGLKPIANKTALEEVNPAWDRSQGHPYAEGTDHWSRTRVRPKLKGEIATSPQATLGSGIVDHAELNFAKQRTFSNDPIPYGDIIVEFDSIIKRLAGLAARIESSMAAQLFLRNKELSEAIIKAYGEQQWSELNENAKFASPLLHNAPEADEAFYLKTINATAVGLIIYRIRTGIKQTLSGLVSVFYGDTGYANMVKAQIQVSRELIKMGNTLVKTGEMKPPEGGVIERMFNSSNLIWSRYNRDVMNVLHSIPGSVSAKKALKKPGRLGGGKIHITFGDLMGVASTWRQMELKIEKEGGLPVIDAKTNTVSPEVRRRIMRMIAETQPTTDPVDASPWQRKAQKSVMLKSSSFLANYALVAYNGIAKNSRDWLRAGGFKNKKATAKYAYQMAGWYTVIALFPSFLEALLHEIVEDRSPEDIFTFQFVKDVSVRSSKNFLFPFLPLRPFSFLVSSTVAKMIGSEDIPHAWNIEQPLGSVINSLQDASSNFSDMVSDGPTRRRVENFALNLSEGLAPARVSPALVKDAVLVERWLFPSEKDVIDDAKKDLGLLDKDRGLEREIKQTKRTFRDKVKTGESYITELAELHKLGVSERSLAQYLRGGKILPKFKGIPLSVLKKKLGTEAFDNYQRRDARLEAAAQVLSPSKLPTRRPQNRREPRSSKRTQRSQRSQR